MSTTMIRSSTALRSALRTSAPVAKRAAAFSTTAPTKEKVTLPDLPYDYGALEPAISGKIMELHHSGHHKTYVTNYNVAQEKMSEALHKGDIPTAITTQSAINFNGGGHRNHSLFWENLAPKSQGGGEPPSGPLGESIDKHFGSYDSLKEKFNAALAGIQGSGWAWLVQNNDTGVLEIKTYANQDAVVGQYHPLMGIDAWEHAYYLQYQNKKAEYFKNVWEVVNWKVAGNRMVRSPLM